MRKRGMCLRNRCLQIIHHRLFIRIASAHAHFHEPHVIYNIDTCVHTASCIHNIVCIIPWGRRRTSTWWDKFLTAGFSPNLASFRVTRSVASGTVSSETQLMQTHVCIHVTILGEDFFASGTLPGLCLPPMGACAVQLKRFRSSEPLAEQVVGVPTGVGRRLGVRLLCGWFRDALLDAVSLILSILDAASRSKLAVATACCQKFVPPRAYPPSSAIVLYVLYYVCS